MQTLASTQQQTLKAARSPKLKLRLLDIAFLVLLALQITMVALRLENQWTASWIVVLSPTLALVSLVLLIVAIAIWRLAHRIIAFVILLTTIVPLAYTIFTLVSKADGHFTDVPYLTALAPAIGTPLALAVVQSFRTIRDFHTFTKSTSSARETLSTAMRVTNTASSFISPSSIPA